MPGTRVVDSQETSISDVSSESSPDLFDKVLRFQPFLSDFRARAFDRYQLPIIEHRGARVLVQDTEGRGRREVLLYCSADYLGLSQHPSVIKASQDAALQYGTSVGSVPAIAGGTDLHALLEKELAQFIGTEDCVLFPTGHAANIGTIAALCGYRDLVVVDKQVHYSLVEGVKVAGCRWESFRHSDPDHLRKVLAAARRRRSDRGILVVLEGVYGIDGDVAPLGELISVANDFGARVLLDDAHATGVLGRYGKGTAEYQAVECPDLTMGSLSKALGSLGGWIATSKATADYLRYHAKSIVFSVGLPASCVAAGRMALRLIRENPAQLDELRYRARQLSDGLRALGLRTEKSDSTIVSVAVGSESTLRIILRDLFFAGVWAEGLPFPAVPRGEERIRFRVRTAHGSHDIEQTINITKEIFAKHGLCDLQRAIQSDTRRHEDMSDIVELAIQAANQRNKTLPWINKSYYGKIIAAEAPWANALKAHRWFRVVEDGTLVAAAQAAVLADTNGVGATGTIGHIHWLERNCDALALAIQQAVQWLSAQQIIRIVAPMQCPVQILGAGVERLSAEGEKPFLETTVDDAIIPVLKRLGFRSTRSNRYDRRLVRPIREACENPEGVIFRTIDRTRLEEEFVKLGEIANATIALLPQCSLISGKDLYQMVADLRDLIVPELWWIAEFKGQHVGFIAAFADVGDAFKAAYGAAGVADNEKLREALHSARTGFVAWLAVLPLAARLDVGVELLNKVLLEMSRRSITSFWLSWEVVDHDRGRAGLTALLGDAVGTADYEIYELNQHSDSQRQ